MKGIKITQQLKDRNDIFKNRNVGSFYIGSIPNLFWGAERIVGGYEGRTDLQTVDGWLEFVEPELTATQKRGEEEIKNGKITYKVVEKSVEELRVEVLSNAEMQKQDLIRTIQENKVIEDMQAVTDDAKLLQNAVIFPVWEEGVAYKLNDKLQGFLLKELVLWKVIQAHTSQADWKPESTPALFVRVALPGQILDWKQPTGAQDAYKIGDKVKFEGSTYESLINGNTWSPTAYPQGWKKL